MSDFTYIDTTRILNETEVVFLNTINELKHAFISSDIPKVMILRTNRFNTHGQYLKEIINKSLCIKAEIFDSRNFDETNDFLREVANGNYLVYFDPPIYSSISQGTRDDWEYNPDIDGVLGSYRLQNIVDNKVTPSKIMAVCKIAAKYRTKAEGTLVWGSDDITGPTVLELLKYNTYRIAKPITIYGCGHHINAFDMEEKVIIAYESHNSTNLTPLYRNPKALYIDACYKIAPAVYEESDKFKNYSGRIVSEDMVKNVDRACALYNILNAYRRVAWSRIGTNNTAYLILDEAMNKINKILE